MRNAGKDKMIIVNSNFDGNWCWAFHFLINTFQYLYFSLQNTHVKNTKRKILECGYLVECLLECTSKYWNVVIILKILSQKLNNYIGLKKTIIHVRPSNLNNSTLAQP